MKGLDWKSIFDFGSLMGSSINIWSFREDKWCNFLEVDKFDLGFVFNWDFWYLEIINIIK